MKLSSIVYIFLGVYLSQMVLYQAAKEAQNLREYAKSLIYLNKLEKIKPVYKLSNFLKGFALQKMSNNSDAMRYYKKHIKFEPSYYQAWFNLAYANMAIGEYQKAIEQFKKTVELKPDYTEAFTHISTFVKQNYPGVLNRIFQLEKISVKIPVRLCNYL